MPRILIAGRGLIAQAVAEALGPDEARLVPHAAVEAEAFEGIETALWGGRHPALGTPAWRLDDDREPAFARLCVKHRTHLVTLGTRKVYARSRDALREDDPVAPWDRYGEHKAALEERLATLCGDGLTRLRLANVFGFEPGRPSFMGRMIDRLATTGEIHFDMSPFTRRDFVPVDTAAAHIAALLRRPPGGIVNIGSGVALECGRLALALIEGYRSGRLVIDEPTERDRFVLEVGAVMQMDATEIIAAAFEIGRRLRHGHPPETTAGRKDR